MAAIDPRIGDLGALTPEGPGVAGASRVRFVYQRLATGNLWVQDVEVPEPLAGDGLFEVQDSVEARTAARGGLDFIVAVSSDGEVLMTAEQRISWRHRRGDRLRPAGVGLN